MAIASTAWMTGLGPYGTNQDVRDVSELMAKIMLKDTAFINEIKYGGTVHNIKTEWLEDSLNSCWFYGTTNGSTKVVVGAGQTAICNRIRASAGALIAPENGLWVTRCTSSLTSGTSTAVVVYGMANSGDWATCASTVKFYVVGEPKRDADSVSDDISKSRNSRFNFTEVFERGLEVQKTREGIDMYAVKGTELNYQTVMRTFEIKRQLNLAFIYSRPKYDSGYTGDDQKRSMAGLIHFLRDPDLDGVYENTLCTNVAGSLSKTNLNQLIDDIYQAGGFDDQSNCCIFCGPKQARAMSALEVDSIRRGPRDRVVGEFMDKFKSDLGFDLDVKVERNFPPTMLAVVDRSRVDYAALKGDTWFLEKMGKTGRTQKYQLSGQYTLRVKNASEAHGLLYGLT